MASLIKILGISGSLRKGSLNTALLRIAQASVPEGCVVQIADIAGLPLYNEDVRLAGAPEAVQIFKTQLADADALLFATPEYNFSFSGVLKNAIDWASRPPEKSPLNGKPVAIMGAGGRLGTARAQYHLRQVAVGTNMLVVNKPELFIAAATEKFDAQGHPLDPFITQLVTEQVQALVRWCRQLNPALSKEIHA